MAQLLASMIDDAQLPFSLISRGERASITKQAWDTIRTLWPSNPDDLVKHLECNRKKCPSVNTILIDHYQNENPPPQLGRSFGDNYLNRQPNVEIVTPTKTVHIPSHLFFNMDETHLHTVAHLTPEVATTTPDVVAVMPLSPTIPAATIVFLVVADGDATLKSVILPTVNTPPDLVPFTTPILSLYPIGQRHLNQETFKNYFLSQITPAITNKRKKSTSLSPTLICDLTEPQITNMPKFTQPVDQSINAIIRNIIAQTIPDHLAVAAADHRQSFMQTFLRATDSALSHRSIQHSFSRPTILMIFSVQDGSHMQ
ncbi:hypothetical protein BLNAU_11601 [Blattamonas nauphoetae]|uniref:Uncharacterized protein n=1 Tax=Blattamonas nauphoetae TaxID=2049346 RepID=A0ABQ9XM32_9EUKA|nr:hypothetical protein BLNAU_11601 [Blattamonas nauphoetae]